MHHIRYLSPMVIAVAVAIGCGSGKPQDAAATTDEQPEAPVQLAQTQTGAAPAAAATTSAAPAGGGSASVNGSVKFTGTAPAPEKVRMDADPVCKQQHTTPVLSEEVVVNGNGTLKHVFVYVKEGVAGDFPAPAAPVVLDQHGCWYTPHVFGIQVNQPLEIVNSDASLHNVNAKPTLNPPFNIAQPAKGMKTQKKFIKPETGIKFKCNVHPWMSAWGHVLSHPFYSVSNDSGTFTISGLPAGTYTIEAWHEKYGTQSQQVTVGDGEAKAVDFSFVGQ